MDKHINNIKLALYLGWVYDISPEEIGKKINFDSDLNLLFLIVDKLRENNYHLEVSNELGSIYIIKIIKDNILIEEAGAQRFIDALYAACSRVIK